MVRIFKCSLVILALMVAGCQYRIIRSSTVSEQETQLKVLEEKKQNAEAQIEKINRELEEKKKEKDKQIGESRDSRISQGGAQAIAVLGTLHASPTKDKYILAGIDGLEVSKVALVDEVFTKDLLRSMENQLKLISEQADQIAAAKKDLETAKDEIRAAKEHEKVLVIEKQKIEEQKQIAIAAEQQKVQQIEEDKKAIEAAMEKERQDREIKDAEDAEKWRKENVWYKKWNPFNGFFDNIKKLAIWIVVFMILGGVLKLASIIFPGVNVVQIAVKSVGRIVGALLKILFGWIPDAFRGMGAVKYEEYKVQETLADNSIGAIQQYKMRRPEEYKAGLKGDLEDWNKEDKTVLEPAIDQKLKKLNLV